MLSPRLVWRVANVVRHAWSAGVDFAFPTSCLCCGRETSSRAPIGPSLCAECDLALRPVEGPACQICAAPVGPYLETANGCIHCRQDKFHFERVIRLGVYRDQLRRAVLQAKTVTGEPLTRTLADLLATTREEALKQIACDVIVPVPHYWTRRFTQQHAASETLAEHLASRLKIRCRRSLLRKVRWTPAQASSPPSVRRQQQKKAFAASSRVRGLKVLLVDDVLTTGATADEAAKALRNQGAASITVAVIARGLGEHG